MGLIPACLVGAVLKCIARSGWPQWRSDDLTYLSKMPVEVKQLGPGWVKGLLQTLCSFLEFTLLQESSHSSDNT